jgi:hypothetical protein
MDRPRFNQRTALRPLWRPVRRSYPASLLFSERGEALSSRPKKLFAVVSPPIPKGGKTIRRVLIFDNNPASLRLLSHSYALDRRGAKQRTYLWVVLGLILVATVIFGML